jgi:hypothetical protein
MKAIEAKLLDIKVSPKGVYPMQFVSVSATRVANHATVEGCAQSDPAHQFIIDNWDSLNSGDQIDLQNKQ